jgi:hypothetical protein
LFYSKSYFIVSFLTLGLPDLLRALLPLGVRAQLQGSDVPALLQHLHQLRLLPLPRVLRAPYAVHAEGQVRMQGVRKARPHHFPRLSISHTEGAQRVRHLHDGESIFLCQMEMIVYAGVPESPLCPLSLLEEMDLTQISFIIL